MTGATDRLRRLWPVLVAVMAAVTCAVVVAACGADDPEDSGEPVVAGGPGGGNGAIRHDPANARTMLTVGSKNFTEQRVLAEIYAQGLEAAGYQVARQLGLGDERTAQNALENGEISGYPEYTGTALASLCGVPTDEIPKDPMAAYEDARACFAEDGLVALPPTPFTSSNEVAVTEAVAARHRLQQISDLARVDQDFTLYGPPECRQRTDCLRGLQDTYGLRFARFAPVDIDRRHEVLRRADRAASIVFTTDPQNRREDIVLLADDQDMFPPYNSTFVVREEVVEQAGDDLPRVIEQVQEGLTDEVMQELNARVDLDGERPAAVARQYLDDAGLV